MPVELVSRRDAGKVAFNRNESHVHNEGFAKYNYAPLANSEKFKQSSLGLKQPNPKPHKTKAEQWRCGKAIMANSINSANTLPGLWSYHLGNICSSKWAQLIFALCGQFLGQFHLQSPSSLGL